MEKKFCTNALCSELVIGLAVLAFVSLAGPVKVGSAAQTKLDTAKIEQLTGVKGDFNEKEGVFTVRAPRTDLQVTTAGVKMNPAMGLTSYAAFMSAGAKTMVMGDTTLARRPGQSCDECGVGQRPGSYSSSQPFFLGLSQSYVHAHRWHGR